MAEVMKGVKKEIKKPHNQLAEEATPMALDLILIGYVSETQTETHGPQNLWRRFGNQHWRQDSDRTDSETSDNSTDEVLVPLALVRRDLNQNTDNSPSDSKVPKRSLKSAILVKPPTVPVSQPKTKPPNATSRHNKEMKMYSEAFFSGIPVTASGWNS
ncbi:hypothetical protein WICPIJ_005998 [Wickerhamomyces pijperi]|uniref:Uncharacterized protein n=1 Tax=Wickerhamomyces pijperi TaxID=599730 RepID=A0A9P8TLE0_WICPI|nr:hypothetical protein WICPIJ_005998 [Wickerhamomyces pijperi]